MNRRALSRSVARSRARKPRACPRVRVPTGVRITCEDGREGVLQGSALGLSPGDRIEIDGEAWTVTGMEYGEEYAL